MESTVWSTTLSGYDVISNSTNGSRNHQENDVSSAYLAFRILHLLLFMAISGFITVRLVLYEHHLRGTKIMRNANLANFQPRTRRQAWHGGEQAVKMRACSILCPLTGTLLYFSKLVYEVIHLLPYDLHFCAFMKNFLFVLMTWTLVFIYLLLWLRQRSFYVHASMKHLTSPVTRFLSVFTVVLILASGVVVPVLFGMARYFVVSTSGCHFVEDTMLAYVYLAVMAAMSIAFHVALLYLFVCPIIRHKSALTPAKERFHKGAAPASGFTHVIKRAVYVTMSCIMSDVTVIITMPLLSSNEDLQTAIEDCIVLANIIAMTLTFVNWRKRLFPFAGKRLDGVTKRRRISVATLQTTTPSS